MMKKIIAILPFLLIIHMTKAQDITGTWNGILEIQGTQLRIVFHIEKTGEGYSTKMDSPDQGATGIATDKTTWSDNTLTISAPALGMKYTGQLDADTREIKGTFSQSGMSLPLNLKTDTVVPKKKPEKGPRPQDPTDFPYHQEEVSFYNKRDDVTLAGTLTLPKGQKAKSVVILISGSGAQNRNEELGGGINHRPFLVLSDYLTRQGIAVLRYDDRGAGESTGDRSISTIDNFALDTEAGVEFLKTRKDLQGMKIGLVGHSEGGIIAPIIASRSKDIDFIILLAGPGVPTDELLLKQSQLISKAQGLPDEMIESNSKLMSDAYSVMKKNNNLSTEQLKEQLTKVFNEGAKKYYSKTVQEQLKVQSNPFESQINQLLSPWFRHALNLDPGDYISKVKIPVLALNGTLDLQVSVKENLDAIKMALDKAKNKNVEIVALEGLNHLFQTAKTGAVSEYGTIEETFNPEAMNKIASWINKL